LCTTGVGSEIRGPQFVDTDFAVTINFPLFEELHLNIQAEMLNLFNHPEWLVIDGYSGNTNNPAQYVTVTNSPAVPGTQNNPEGLGSNGARDIQFRVQLLFQRRGSLTRNLQIRRRHIESAVDNSGCFLSDRDNCDWTSGSRATR
jgi:hypothetical protein